MVVLQGMALMEGCCSAVVVGGSAQLGCSRLDDRRVLLDLVYLCRRRRRSLLLLRHQLLEL